MFLQKTGKLKIKNNFSTAKKDESGRVITDPRNFTTKKLKKGKIDAVLFQKPSYICTGDLYKSRSVMQLRTVSKDGYLKAGHEAPFKPVKNPKEKLYKASYVHQNERTDIKKNHRDEDGAVIIETRNIITNPPKQGLVGRQTTFGGNLPHMADEYDYGKVVAKKEFLDHKAKEQEKPFSQRVGSMKVFNKVKLVYGEDVILLPKPTPVKHVPAVTHDMPFRPSKPPRSGYACTIEPYPEHKANPPKRIVRKIRLDGDPEPAPAFKFTHKYKSRPMTSIACNLKNLKSSFPSIFKK